MSKVFTTLGWQWGCHTRIASEDCDDPDKRFFDSWQNPEDGPSMARAAQAHADRTGHETYLERHQRRLIQPRSNKADSCGHFDCKGPRISCKDGA